MKVPGGGYWFCRDADVIREVFSEHVKNSVPSLGLLQYSKFFTEQRAGRRGPAQARQVDEARHVRQRPAPGMRQRAARRRLKRAQLSRHTTRDTPKINTTSLSLSSLSRFSNTCVRADRHAPNKRLRSRHTSHTRVLSESAGALFLASMLLRESAWSVPAESVRCTQAGAVRWRPRSHGGTRRARSSPRAPARRGRTCWSTA